MAEHLSDDEQLEAFKRWWSENGKAIVVGVILALGAYFGWGAWQAKQQADAEAASALYQELTEAVTPAAEGPLPEDTLATARHLAEQLKQEHDSTLYASQAALWKARLAVSEADLQAAADELQWVLDRDLDPVLTLLTRARLARVQLAQEEYEKALQTAADTSSASYKALFAEIRGDVLLAQGKRSDARGAYQLALEHLVPELDSRRPLLEMKVNDLQDVAIAANSAESPGESQNPEVQP